MNMRRIRTAILGLGVLAGTALFADTASADARVTIHTPHVSVSFGSHGGYRHAPPPPPPPPVHACYFETRPVSRYYIDECGRKVHYVEYVQVRVCESYHKPAYRGHGKYDRRYEYRSDKHKHKHHKKDHRKYKRDYDDDDDDD
jgi:hypothetical protein